MKVLVAAATLVLLVACTGRQQKSFDNNVHRLTVNPQVSQLREQSGDAALSARVSSAIAAQAGTNVFSVSVTAHAGVVTLRGDVPTTEIARTVLHAASSVPGVRHVEDHVAVKQ